MSSATRELRSPDSKKISQEFSQISWQNICAKKTFDCDCTKLEFRNQDINKESTIKRERRLQLSVFDCDILASHLFKTFSTIYKRLYFVLHTFWERR